MTSRLETLPPELFHLICQNIDKTPSKRKRKTTFKNLSRTSKKCRSHATHYIFHNLAFQKLNLKTLNVELNSCVQTLGRLRILYLVRSVVLDVTIADLEVHNTETVGFLKNLPSLAYLEIRTSRELPARFVEQLDETLAARCVVVDWEPWVLGFWVLRSWVLSYQWKKKKLVSTSKEKSSSDKST